jgi:hypothetical protein
MERDAKRMVRQMQGEAAARSSCGIRRASISGWGTARKSSAVMGCNLLVSGQTFQRRRCMLRSHGHDMIWLRVCDAWASAAGLLLLQFFHVFTRCSMEPKSCSILKAFLFITINTEVWFLFLK